MAWPISGWWNDGWGSPPTPQSRFGTSTPPVSPGLVWQNSSGVYSNTITPSGLTSIGVTTANISAANISNLIVSGGVQFQALSTNGIVTVGGGNGTASSIPYTGSGSVILSIGPTLTSPTIDVITAPASTGLTLNGGGSGGVHQVTVSSLGNLLVGTITDFASGSGQLKVNGGASVGGTLTVNTITSAAGQNLVLLAGSTNQSVILAPTGTGTVQVSPSGFLQINYSGTAANTHGIQIGTGNTSSFIFSNYQTFGDGTFWSDNYTVTNLGVSSIPFATNPTSAIRQNLGAISFMNGAANVAPTTNVMVSALGNLLVGTTTDYSSGAGQLKVNGQGRFGAGVSVTNGGNTLVLNNTNSAAYNGLINLQRQGSNKFFIGLDPSDNFAILNNLSSSTVMSISPSGNMTITGNLTMGGSSTMSVNGLNVAGDFNLSAAAYNADSGVTPTGSVAIKIAGGVYYMVVATSP